jgi:hypothetical protein
MAMSIAGTEIESTDHCWRVRRLRRLEDYDAEENVFPILTRLALRQA